MDRPLYLTNPYLKEFEAVVKGVDRAYVSLDQTAFYPNSGGQPFDKGKIERISDHKVFNIVYVAKIGDAISHEVDSPGLKIGDKVVGTIDWPRRHLFMRYHTASHILCSIINKETGALITGSQIAEDKCRNDFSLESLDRDQIFGFAEKANLIIQKGIPVRTSFLSRQEVIADPDLIKLAKGMSPDIQEFRIVEIEGVDRQACGGCHVRNTSEIGRIMIKDIENKGKSNRRVYFTVN